jgi:hypothetical protein
MQTTGQHVAVYPPGRSVQLAAYVPGKAAHGAPLSQLTPGTVLVKSAQAATGQHVATKPFGRSVQLATYVPGLWTVHGAEVSQLG